MKLPVLAAILTAAGFAQTPDIDTIMRQVGENQERAVEARKQFTFVQKQLLRLNRGGGKIAREERREYTILPGSHGVEKQLTHFEGRYDHKGKYISYDHPGYKHQNMDIDGEFIGDLSDELTNDKRSR